MTDRKIKYGDFNFEGKYVVYLITREFRVKNNWSLIEAANLAKENNKKLIVIPVIDNEKELVNDFQLPFLINGVTKLEIELFKINITMLVINRLTVSALAELIEPRLIFHLVTDFLPLKKVIHFINELSLVISISVVDAHNIVPCFIASEKLEHSAYTIRPKIIRNLSHYMTKYPKLPEFAAENKTSIFKYNTNYKIESKGIMKGGYYEAINILDSFIKYKINEYSDKRNDPNENKNSNLSPYLHFGFISSQEIVLKIHQLEILQESKESFFEEIVIRKELADNFCFYNDYYDSINGIKAWALKTLNDHRDDEREFLYEMEEFENSNTHDRLWNAAQNQLKRENKIHGYLRMYWAKKILEWSNSPEEAFDIAIYLNDKFAMDGIDPNGYTGIAWSIGGVHDRAWKEREVYGKIRYMNYNGCKRKFDIEEYIRKYGD